MKLNLKFVALLFFALIALGSCNKNESYLPAKYLDKLQQDTLLADMVTYIYIKPKYADNQTRHEQQYRKYYANQSNLFSFQNYHVTSDGTHYFYVIRPAFQGKKRGVGGKFRIAPSKTGSLRLTDFEELFNTVVMPEDSLKLVGNKIFRYLVKHGNADIFLYDPAVVEWPDHRLRYDKTENEWRYTTK